jgi:hypothetical protein
VTVAPRKPTRGQSAFKTDLCIFEHVAGIELPRVVIEFKARITTHAILTYSAKARKHRQIYPYLRYGIIMAGEGTIAGRVFVHNEALDFGLAALSLDRERLSQMVQRIIEREARASRLLEEIAFKKPNVIAFPYHSVGNSEIFGRTRSNGAGRDHHAASGSVSEISRQASGRQPMFQEIRSHLINTATR